MNLILNNVWESLSEDEKFQVVTQRILKEHLAAFEELAK